MKRSLAKLNSIGRRAFKTASKPLAGRGSDSERTMERAHAEKSAQRGYQHPRNARDAGPPFLRITG